MTKTLFISAGLAAIVGLPCHAQMLGAQGGLGASVNAPLGSAVAGAGLGPSGQTSGSASVMTPGLAPVTGAVQGAVGGASSTAMGAVNPSPDAINDARTLNPGTASTNASARVSSDDAAASAGVTGGMIIQDIGGMTLGRVVSVTKNSAGQVSSFVIETADGVRRSMPAGGLTVKAGAAATTQSEADLVALPQVR